MYRLIEQNSNIKFDALSLHWDKYKIVWNFEVVTIGNHQKTSSLNLLIYLT